MPKVIKVKNSIWCRYIKLVGLAYLEDTSLFSKCIRGKMGNNESLGFWRSTWIGKEPFSTQFLDLLSCVGKKSLKIVKTGF